MKKILITGTAGFIGFHLANYLLGKGYEVIGLDVVNDYYDVNLKYSRLEQQGIPREKIIPGSAVSSSKFSNYRFIQLNLEDKEALLNLFKKEKIQVVINLAAQAGVRYSLTHPEAYISSNITGFLNVLEAARYNKVEHLIYASSSSVYGLNAQLPFSVSHNVDHPVSLYAASKKSNELMAHTYSHLYGIPTTGLRFFTVYGPWGRPDMALFIFTKAILEGREMDVYNNGDMWRDFTYIDDIVESISRLVEKPARSNAMWDPVHPDPATSPAPYRIFNIGNNQPVKLMDFVNAIEEYTGKKAKINFQPVQPGDVLKTWADVNDLEEEINFKPGTSIQKGIENFVSWYREYYGV